MPPSASPKDAEPLRQGHVLVKASPEVATVLVKGGGSALLPADGAGAVPSTPSLSPLYNPEPTAEGESWTRPHPASWPTGSPLKAALLASPGAAGPLGG